MSHYAKKGNDLKSRALYNEMVQSSNVPYARNEMEFVDKYHIQQLKTDFMRLFRQIICVFFKLYKFAISTK